jgi:ketosteroid isomerase-like protein
MKKLILVLAAGLLASPSFAAAPVNKAAVVEQIKALETSVNEAYAANDLPTYFSYYWEDLTQWFPEGRVSLPEYQKSWGAFIKAGNRIQSVRISDLQIQLNPSGDTAVATLELHVKTKTVAGAVTTEEFHETDVWFNRGGVWKIAHLHYSPAPAPVATH